ncbi:MAG: hypothetical protein SGI91_22570 [Alphaproteobacteria bacterium]|nr:hypothetical protein [Alphaproteobacteria bacterium]
MEFVQQILDTVNNYMQTGFYKVNAVQGLLIAIVTAYFLSHWKQLFVYALGAVIAHVIFDVMIPVIGRNAPFRLPPLVDIEYWRYLLALYIGFLIIIPVFFLVKIMVLRGGHAGGGGGH